MVIGVFMRTRTWEPFPLIFAKLFLSGTSTYNWYINEMKVILLGGSSFMRIEV